MQSTMQDSPLTIAEILRYAMNVHGDRVVTTATGTGSDTRPIARWAGRPPAGQRPAQARHRRRWRGRHLHVEQPGAPGGPSRCPRWARCFTRSTFGCSPSRSSSSPTRPGPDRHRRHLTGSDLAPVLHRMETVHTVIVVGSGDLTPFESSGKRILRYHEITAGESDEFDWPTIDENSAAAMCYTEWAPPAIPRVWCIHTGRVTCTRWRSAAETVWD